MIFLSTPSSPHKWRDANLLIISSSFPQHPGSIEGGFVLELARKLVSTPFRPLVLSPHFHNGPSYEWWPPVRIFRFPYFFPSRYEQLAYGSGMAFNIRKNPFILFSVPSFLISEFLFSLCFTKKNPISLIHTHWLIPQGFVGSLLRRFLNIPHIATVHGSDLNIIKKHPALHPLCRFIVWNTDIITVNSTFMQRQLIGVMPESAEKIRVIPMGVNPNFFQEPERDDIPAQFSSHRVILSVGRLIDWKGTKFLIEAFPSVLKKYSNALLVIIGTGPEEEILRKSVSNLKLDKSVRFMGFVSKEDLPSYYRSADVFVLPSINLAGKTEGLGVVLLEAMASGCPVIGSNVGGIPDIITDGENGFLVPEQEPGVLGEKIILLLSDFALREKFRNNGYTCVKNIFSWEIIAKRFSVVYSRVISNTLQSEDSA